MAGLVATGPVVAQRAPVEIRFYFPVAVGGPIAALLARLIDPDDPSQRNAFDFLAVWDGVELHPPGDFNTVFPRNTIQVRPLPSGTEALGAMETADGTEVFFGAVVAKPIGNNGGGVARMKDGKWQMLPALPASSEFDPPLSGFGSGISAMKGFDDGFGSQLYVAGLVKTPIAGAAGQFEYRPWVRWTGTQWELLAPTAQQRITSNLLPYDVNGVPALLRTGTPFSATGSGLLRWIRPSAPCP
jgi:hypothetical protein